MDLKKLFPIIIFSCFLHLTSFSIVDGKKSDIKKLNEMADEAFYNQNYYLSYDCYDQLQKLLPEYENYYDFRKGSCLVLLQQEPKRALNLLLNGQKDLEDSEVSDEYLYYLAKAYHLNSQFDKAIEIYNKLIQLEDLDNLVKEASKREIEICENAKKVVMDERKFEIINLGDSLNSKFPDYKPSISTDESTLIFTSRREDNTGNKKDIDGRYFEDIKIAYRNQYGYWSAPKSISDKINTENHEASVALSADGTRIIFYKGNNNSGELFTSTLQGNDWSEASKIDNGKTINSKTYWETSASLSLDENIIYFTSDRKGGKGGVDIYRSFKKDGVWGKPENLGDIINTPYDEESPYIHPDGKTLYFSSKGHSSIGGFDIFRSRFEGGKWSEPENVGYPINSVFDDIHFSITANGKKAYFCSSRDKSIGAEDIYSVILDENVKPLVLIKGIVKAEDNSILDVDLNVYNKESNEKQKYVYKPNKNTGKYLLILPPGKSYTMFVSAEGYENYEINLNIPDQDKFHEFYQEIILRKPKAGDSTSQEITVINSFDDLRESIKFDPSLLQPDASYLKELIGDLVYLTDSAEKDANATAIAEAKRNQLETVTDNVTENFKTVVENKNFTESISYSSNYAKDVKLETKIMDGDTFRVIPADLFVDSDLKDSLDLALLNKDKSNLNNLTDNDERIRDSLEMEKAKLLAEQLKNKNTTPVLEGFEDYMVTVYFAFNTFMYEQKYKNELDKFIELFKKNNASKIVIEGHADAMGSDSYNNPLSRKRADAIAAYLRTKGINSSSIEIKAYGEQRPAAPNTKPDGTDNPEGRSLNRRAIVKMFK